MAQKLPNVAPPPAKFKIDPYYTKFTWAREFTVLGRGASDEALLKANDTIRKMFAYRHDILKALIADGVKLVVLGRSEKLADLPEFRALRPGGLRSALARTLDYTPETKLLVVGEENVAGRPRDPNLGENQVIRVLAGALYHVTASAPSTRTGRTAGGDVQQYELRVKRLDVRFDEKLGRTATGGEERENGKGTAAVHDRVALLGGGRARVLRRAGTGCGAERCRRPVNTREALAAYDPGLHALVRRRWPTRATWTGGSRHRRGKTLKRDLFRIWDLGLGIGIFGF